MIAIVPPKVAESGGLVLKRTAWGCFVAAYVCILLCMLLFPALLLDYAFLSRLVEEPLNVKQPLHFDYTLSHPTAVIYLHPSLGVHSSTVKSGTHSEHARAIPIRHKVHITVTLTVPESDYNRNLGVFQLSAELLAENGEPITMFRKACMLRFHSAPIRMLKTFWVSLPSLLGISTESQTLVVRFMKFEEQLVATSAVRIFMQPKAGMPLQQGIPEVYRADVHVESQLPWLKNLMWKWKWIIYIWTGLMLYIVEVVVVLCCCRRSLWPNSWMAQNDDSNAAKVVGSSAVEVPGSGTVKDGEPRKRAAIQHRSLNEHIPM